MKTWKWTYMNMKKYSANQIKTVGCDLIHLPIKLLVPWVVYQPGRIGDTTTTSSTRHILPGQFHPTPTPPSPPNQLWLSLVTLKHTDTGPFLYASRTVYRPSAIVGLLVTVYSPCIHCSSLEKLQQTTIWSALILWPVKQLNFTNLHPHAYLTLTALHSRWNF